MRSKLFAITVLLFVGSTLRFSYTSASTSISAADIQRWSVSNGLYAINFFGDGTMLAARSDVVQGPQVPGNTGVPAEKMDPATGATIGSIYSPDVRTSISLASSTNELDEIVGGYENRFSTDKDGNYVRQLRDLGCCNIPRIPVALDADRDAAFVLSSGQLFGLNLSTGNTDYFYYGAGDNFGSISMADTNTLYTSGRNGNVTRLHPTSGNQWTANIDTGDLQTGAVATDGSYVVTSGPSHFAGNVEPGRLARVLPTGMVAWNNNINAVTPPVIGSDGTIFVGTQAAPVNENGPGAVEAYDPSDGSLLWSSPVDGLPNDVLIGDDGAVYVATGGFNNGRVYSLGQSDGEVRQIITDVQGAWEIVLRAGLIYASGYAPFGGTASITALPVAANNYDVNSPWPVRYHDNQRTSNRTHPILTPPRIPGPTPTPTPTASPTPTPVGYDVQVLYDQTKAHKSGSTVPIKIRVLDANGNNVSSASIDVHAVSVIQTSSQASTILDDAGNANPDFDFRYDAALEGYVFNLKTTGYGTGTYLLNFVISGGAQSASVGFQVRQ